MLPSFYGVEMAVDLSLTLGDVITAGAILGGGLIAWGALRGTVIALTKDFGVFTSRSEAQFDDVKVELKKLGEVMVILAESKGRMDRMDDRAILQGSRIDESTKQIISLRDDVTQLRFQIADLKRPT